MEHTTCPGLKFERGVKWWVPQGANIADVTYCDHCRKSMNITNCRPLPVGEHSCSCDSFLLKNNVKKALFNVSLWHLDYNTHIPSSSESGSPLGLDGIYQMHSNTPFVIYVSSLGLPENQFFQVEVLCNDRPVSVQAAICPTHAPMYSHGALIQGFHHGVRDFKFAARGSMDDSTWDLAKSQIISDIKIKITVFQLEEKLEGIKLSDTFMGKFEITGRQIVLDTADKVPPQIGFVSDNHRTVASNPPIKMTPGLELIEVFSKVTPIPIEVNIRLESTPTDSVEDIDKYNKSLVDTIIAERKTKLMEKFHELTEIQRSNTKSVEQTEELLLDVTTELSKF